MNVVAQDEEHFVAWQPASPAVLLSLIGQPWVSDTTLAEINPSG
jgi:hypothetical protein